MPLRRAPRFLVRLMTTIDFNKRTPGRSSPLGSLAGTSLFLLPLWILGCSGSDLPSSPPTKDGAGTPNDSGTATDAAASQDALPEVEAWRRDAGSDGSPGGGDARGDESSPGAQDAEYDAPDERGPSSDGHVDAGPVDVEPDAPEAAQDGGPDAIADAPHDDCAYGAAGEALDLRCTGLYADWQTKTIADGVTQYDPGLHLWSDGAVKTRWILLPAGTKIDTSDMDEWTFPTGTKLWKEFALGGKRIETRMIWKRGDSSGSWYRTTYRWSADESGAHELLGGELNADGNGYEVPPQTACAQCHGGRRDSVLGFEAVSLASPGAKFGGPADWGDGGDAGGRSALEVLSWSGRITEAPQGPLTIPGSPTETAALGYLHANCGTACHNPGLGWARPTGFWMRLNVADLASVATTDAFKTGVDQPAGFSIPGVASTRRIATCDPQSSCVYYRMTHRDGVDGAPSGTQMPPLASHKVDDWGASVIRAWIEESCAADAGDGG